MNARIQAPRPDGLGRPRLDTSLQAAFQHRLTLVLAPAGSGKTTALAHFAERADSPVAWFRADGVDGTEAGLVRHLERACVAVVPGLFGAMPGPSWTTVEDVAAAFDAHPIRCAIVVDDLHGLHGTTAEAAIGRLADLLPPGVAVVAAGRRPPSFPLSRLRLQGDLLELGPDDLRFRAWEVEQLFRDVYGEVLSPQDLSTLTRRTEGWAAGLQLFHLASRGRTAAERHTLVEGLGQSSRLVREYLADNVLDGLQTDVRQFLVDTCVLSTLSGELCDDLLTREGSAEVLAALEHRNLFCVAVDDGDTYRYHEVLRTHLEATLVEDVGSTVARDRYRAAGRLHEKAGVPVDAIRAYCRAEDWDAVGRLLGGAAEQLVGGPGEWLDALPPSLVAEDPWLVLASARRSLAHGRLRNGFDELLRAETSFRTGSGAELARADRALVRPWVDARPDRSTSWSGLLRAATVRDPAAVAREASRHADPTFRLVEGIALILAGRATDGQTLLVDVAEHSDVGGALALGATAAAALAALWGAPSRVGALVVDERAEALGLPWAMRLSAAVVALDSGGDVPDAVRRAFDADLDEWGAALLALHAGMAAVAQGRPAVVLLDEAAERLRFLGAEVLELWARAYLAGALVAAGDTLEALDTARRVVDRARRAAAPAVVAFAQVAAARAATGAESVAWTQRATATAAQHGLPVTEPDEQGGAALALPQLEPTDEIRPAPAPRPLVLQLFGGFRLEIHGRQVDLAQVKPRARAALRLLALRAPGPVHREALCAQLWPEADVEAATRNLQVAVSSLRQLLEPGVARGAHTLLVRDGDAYRLALPAGAVVDLVAVHDDLAAGRQALAAGHLDEAAVTLLRALDVGGAELLAEDGPADWVVAERDVVRSSLADAACRLAASALRAGMPDLARDVAERGLRIDRFRDDLWRHLVDAHRATGDAAAAARTEHDYAAVLVDLGL